MSKAYSGHHCLACGASDHWKSECMHQLNRCAKCKMVGHTAAMCFPKDSGPPPPFIRGGGSEGKGKASPSYSAMKAAVKGKGAPKGKGKQRQHQWQRWRQAKTMSRYAWSVLMAFLPCGHLCICKECLALPNFQGQTASCPICCMGTAMSCLLQRSILY